MTEDTAFDFIRQAILPIIVLGAHGEMTCVGTAFVLKTGGRSAFLCSAAHVLAVFTEVDRPHERHQVRTLFTIRKPLVVLKNAKPFAIFFDRKSGGQPALIGQTVCIDMLDIGTCVAQFEPWVPEHLNFNYGLALDSTPVKVGEMVMAFGYPDMDFAGDAHADNAFSGKLHFPKATVTAVYPVLGPTGQKAPCFSLDVPLVGGMSGGPVVTQDEKGQMFVRGIVRSDFKYADPDAPAGGALVTAIWPLLIFPFKPPTENGDLDWSQSVMELERRGTLVDRARGHERIEVLRDDAGKLVYAKYRDADGVILSEILQPEDSF